MDRLMIVFGASEVAKGKCLHAWYGADLFQWCLNQDLISPTLKKRYAAHPKPLLNITMPADDLEETLLEPLEDKTAQHLAYFVGTVLWVFFNDSEQRRRAVNRLLDLTADRVVRESCGDALTLAGRAALVTSANCRQTIIEIGTVGGLAAEVRTMAQGVPGLGEKHLHFLAAMTSEEWATIPTLQLILVWENLLLPFLEDGTMGNIPLKKWDFMATLDDIDGDQIGPVPTGAEGNWQKAWEIIGNMVAGVMHMRTPKPAYDGEHMHDLLKGLGQGDKAMRMAQVSAAQGPAVAAVIALSSTPLGEDADVLSLVARELSHLRMPIQPAFYFYAINTRKLKVATSPFDFIQLCMDYQALSEQDPIKMEANVNAASDAKRAFLKDEWRKRGIMVKFD